MQVRLSMGLMVFALCAACSPMNAVRDIHEAQGALAAAKDAGASRYAIYEYTAATEYLHKAREENNYSDYDAARTYATHARELAQQARSIAQRNGGPDRSRGPGDPMMEPEKPAHEVSTTSAAIEDIPQDEVLQSKSKGRAK